jgi:hypothetical protein
VDDTPLGSALGHRYDGFAMRRVAVAGALALTVLQTACGGADPSGIQGLLWLVGGRPPGLNQPTRGSVTVYPVTGEGEVSLDDLAIAVGAIAEIEVEASGEFRVRLSPGVYIVTARMVGGHACQSQRVEVGAGRYTEVTIVCSIR